MSGGSSSYLLEMVVLISLEDILTQTIMGVGRVTLPSKGPIKGANISALWKKFQSFYIFN